MGFARGDVCTPFRPSLPTSASSVARRPFLLLRFFTPSSVSSCAPCSCTAKRRDFSLGELSRERTTEKSEADKIVDGMDFGELCDEFECISSPLVESTARQLARDILELREGSRALGTFAVSVKYKDPLRTFTGRDKYKRPLWLTGALENPSVVRKTSQLVFLRTTFRTRGSSLVIESPRFSQSVQEMVMLSTSVLSIKWTVKGKPKWVLSAISGDVVIRITSRFTLNQISGQVIEHQEDWDLSSSSSIAQAFFWTSRGFFAATESGKDFTQFIKTFPSRLPSEKENMEIYPDPAGDPMKFFQRDDSFQQDLYQVALLLAVLYFVVQWLRTTL